MLTILLIFIPLALSGIAFTIRDEVAVKRFSLLSAVAVFGLAVAALVTFKTGCPCHLLAEADWFSSFGISLRFGLDGTGLLLVLMTTLLVPVVISAASHHSYSSPNAFYGLILLMESALIGVFASYDGMVFYIFWELALIPAWFICALWGGEDRIRITFKFFIYTFTGSLFMLLALIWVFLHTPGQHSFAWEAMTSASLSPVEQTWILAAFFLAFAIKIPIFPFHTWQPDTYTTAPASGTMLLAGMMLKMGLFGIIRWMIPLTFNVLPIWTPWLTGLAVTGVVYGSILALRQQDIKRLIAYSSIAHVGLMAAGLFTLTQQAAQGAVIQMVAHGINVTGLFFIIDLSERRNGTRMIGRFGGIAGQAPWFSVTFMIILLGSIALPLTNGFPGEFLLLTGLFRVMPVMAAVAGLSVIFSAVYMLWMYQRVMLGTAPEHAPPFQDLTIQEAAALLPLVLLVILMGLFPSYLLDLTINDFGQFFMP
jgi:NADH-quinone oxidoreductase subunit M